MPTHLIKKTTNYFIQNTGRVFKIENGKEVDLEIKKAKRTNRLFIYIERKPKDYLNLMLEYFKPEIKHTEKIKYKVNSLNRIESSSIIVKPFISSILCNADELKHDLYRCVIKSNSANARCVDKITSIQVFYTLKIHSYKCIYCYADIDAKNWHLDHYNPLARGGKNLFENIVPSCPICNVMKGALTGEQFYRHCKKISEKFMFSKQFDNNG